MMSSQIVPQGYKQTKVGVVPEDWDLFRTDTILQRVRKKVEVEKDTNYQQIGIRSHAKGIFHKKFVTGEELGNKSVFWIEEDCFIVNIVFAWEQAVSKTTKNERGMIASHRFPMYQPKDSKIDIDYLLYFFKSKRGKHILGLASPGGAGRNKTLGQGEFSELKIPLPSLKEQQKIANILTTWDDAISKQNELIKAKEELKKGLMQKLLSSEVRFGGFEGEWEEVRLKEISFKKSSNISANSLEKNTGKYKVFGASGILRYIDFFKEDEEYISIVKDGAGVGRVLLCEKNSSVLGTLDIIKSNDNIDLYFIYLLLKRINFKKYINGSTIPHIYYKDYSIEKIKLPPLQEQQKIAEVLSNADKEIDLLKNELAELKEQKKGLMQKLLTGEVRVKI